MAREMMFLQNAPRGARKRGRGRAAARKRASSRGSKKRSTRKAVPAWVRAKGFSSWKTYMASIRPGGKMAKRKRSTARKSAARKTTRRRRRSTTSRAAPRRRRARRNAPSFTRGLVPMVMGGAVDAAELLAGKAAVRFVRSRVGLEGNTTTGSLVEFVTAVAGAMAIRKFVGGAKGANAAKMFLAGGISAPMETVVKQSGIPYVSAALGDEGELPLLGSGYLTAIGDTANGGVGSYELGSYETAEA